MHGLILDTSSNKNFICLCEGTKILSSQNLPYGKDLSKDLFPTLKNLLDKNGLQFENVSYIGIGTGPGSYTGTRAGASAAQSLAFSRQIPAIPFCSLLTYTPEGPGTFTIFMKAKNGSYFVMETTQEDGLKYNLHTNLSEDSFLQITKNKHLIEATMEGSNNPNYTAISQFCYQEFLENKKDPFNLSLFYLHTP